MSARTETAGIHGLMAEFESATQLVEAANRTREAGYVDVDAYSPIPIEELHHAIGFPETKLPLAVLIGGLLGAAGGFTLEWWVSTQAYLINVGGKPPVSWPMFIPVTFECGILAAALTCAVGMIVLNKLPMPYHPVFNVPGFALASRDRFFLCIEALDPKFDRKETQEFLAGLQPREVTEVPH